MNILTELQTGYLAGIVDGEGTIGITRSSLSDNISLHYHPKVEVYSTNYALMEWCQFKTSVGIIYTHCKRTGNNKTSYIWRLARCEITPFLTVIEPYLIIKRVQAKLMLEYCDKCLGRPKNTVPDDIKILREIIYEELAALNKKGING